MLLNANQTNFAQLYMVLFIMCYEIRNIYIQLLSLSSGLW